MILKMTFRKQAILIGLIIMTTQLINAQINGVTETGDEVILYQDGTWKFLSDVLIEDETIKLNKKNFTKDIKATFLVKSKKTNVGIWINPKKWSFNKGTDDTAAEFQFQKKGNDIYAMLITEKEQIPIETLKAIAHKNAKSVAPDTKIIKEEYRFVNGNKILMMQMLGTIQGLKFVYTGYYFSSSAGTIQLLTYTKENLVNDYIAEIEMFLNGLIEL